MYKGGGLKSGFFFTFSPPKSSFKLGTDMKQGEQAGFLNPSGTGSNGFANNFIFTTYSENKVCTINTTVQR